MFDSRTGVVDLEQKQNDRYRVNNAESMQTRYLKSVSLFEGKRGKAGWFRGPWETLWPQFPPASF